MSKRCAIRPGIRPLKSISKPVRAPFSVNSIGGKVASVATCSTLAPCAEAVPEKPANVTASAKHVRDNRRCSFKAALLKRINERLDARINATLDSLKRQHAHPHFNTMRPATENHPAQQGYIA